MPKGIYPHKSIQERFWSKVSIKGLFDCWEWNAGINKSGYGTFRVNDKKIYAHRFAYELYHGKIPENKQVNHICHNCPCCNPFHTYAGTPQDNTNDMIRANRQRWEKGELSSRAKLTEKQVREIKENKDKLSQNKQAIKYNVSRWAIRLILYNKNWKYLNAE